jgi:hypothetical protein
VAPDVTDALRVLLDASWAARRAAHDALVATETGARSAEVDAHLVRAVIIAARQDIEAAHDAMRHCARVLREVERRGAVGLMTRS